MTYNYDDMVNEWETLEKESASKRSSFGGLTVRNAYYTRDANGQWDFKNEITRETAQTLPKGSTLCRSLWRVDRKPLNPSWPYEPYEKGVLVSGYGDWKETVVPSIVRAVKNWAESAPMPTDPAVAEIQASWPGRVLAKGEERAAVETFGQLLALGNLYVECTDEPQKNPSKKSKKSDTVYTVYALARIWPHDLEGCRKAMEARYGSGGGAAPLEDKLPAEVRLKATELWTALSGNAATFEKVVRNDPFYAPHVDEVLKRFTQDGPH